jgi:hypothetical protein
MKPTFTHEKPVIWVAVLGMLGTAIGVGVLTAVTGLFQGEGIPLGRLAAGERTCTQNAFLSERETCMREWLAASYLPSVAKK